MGPQGHESQCKNLPLAVTEHRRRSAHCNRVVNLQTCIACLSPCFSLFLFFLLSSPFRTHHTTWVARTHSLTHSPAGSAAAWTWSIMVRAVKGGALSLRRRCDAMWRFLQPLRCAPRTDDSPTRLCSHIHSHTFVGMGVRKGKKDVL